MTLAELIASGRATCSVEEASEIWGVGRCTGYEEAVTTFGAIRVGRKLRVPVPRLLAALGIPLPEEWQPSGEVAPRCQCADSSSDSSRLRSTYPTVDSAASASLAVVCPDLTMGSDSDRRGAAVTRP